MRSDCVTAKRVPIFPLHVITNALLDPCFFKPTFEHFTLAPCADPTRSQLFFELIKIHVRRQHRVLARHQNTGFALKPV